MPVLAEHSKGSETAGSSSHHQSTIITGKTGLVSDLSSGAPRTVLVLRP